MPDETATRRELAELRRAVNANMSRLERALGRHERQHQDDARARTVGRRWLAGILIAVAALVETPLLYLVAHLH